MARPRTGSRQQSLSQGSAQSFNDRVSIYLKNPFNFPPELGQWVRSQIVRNPTVKIDPYQLPNLDKKHAVGTTGEPAFLNGWVNYAGGFDICAFYKDNQSRVYLQGMVKSGTIGASIFTLPLGYRPLGGQIVFDAQSFGALGRVDVLASGDVVAQTANANWISLSGLSFRIS